MRIAFYAPLKSPSHPVPSGDRQMARLLMQALRAAGHTPDLASSFRSWDGGGDPARQLRLRGVARRLAQRLVRRIRAFPPEQRPQCWFTYHSYYKAPDWLGPRVAAECGIPYVVAEVSYAPKRASGPWALGHHATRESIQGADGIIIMNSRDRECVLPLLGDSTRTLQLAPFMDTSEVPGTRSRAASRQRIAAERGLSTAVPWILAVGMMREGDKLASYLVLADALGRMRERDWRLIVIGDGPERPSVEAAFSSWASGRVVFTGEQSRARVLCFMRAADLYVWPAINEAYGMALLEAQVAGLPVVAGDFGGVPDIVRHARTGLIVQPDDAGELAAAVDSLLARPGIRLRLGRSAEKVARRDHDLAAAARALRHLLEHVVAPDRR